MNAFMPFSHFKGTARGWL